MKIYSVIWKLDGDYMWTDAALTPQQAETSADLIHAIIRAEHAEDHSEDEIADIIATALDDEHPGFCGYEIIAAFHAPAPLEHLTCS